MAESEAKDAAIGLIDDCIDITTLILDSVQAVQDDQGLPSSLRSLFNELPIIQDLLNNARENCNNGTATEEASNDAMPVLEQCKKASGELGEILRKAWPKNCDDRSQRTWRSVKTIFLSCDSQFRKLLHTIQDDLRLLEQKQVYVIGNRLDKLQELTEALGGEDDGKYRHSGTGNIIANEGGTITNYVTGGSNNRQTIIHGTYHEGTTLHYQPPGQSERLETPPKPSSNIPFPPDPYYIERAALSKQIHTLLTKPGGRAALVGLGGIGKSQLAIEYARAVRQASPQTWVLWIHASSKARFEQSVREVADLLKLYGRKDPNANVLQLLKSWLCNASKGKWLIVLDNADSADFLVTQMPKTAGDMAAQRRLDYIPASDHGSVLLTARDKNEALKLVHEVEIVHIRPMSQLEAEALLARKLGSRSDNDQQLVQALDCIPLAITQAGAFIKERGLRCTVRQYCDMLENSRAVRTQLLQRHVLLPNRDVEAVNAVMLTWQISFKHLQATQPDAANLLSLMSFCDCLAIPEVLINADIGNPDQSFSLSVFEENIAALCSFSFVSETTDLQIWEMHRLVQDAMQMWLKEQKQHEKILSKFVHRIATAFPTADFENWSLCQVLFPHAVSITECKPVDKFIQLEWASVMSKAAWYANGQGNYDVALSMGKLAMDTQSGQVEKESKELLRSKAIVAGALSNQGQWAEAEALLIAVTETCKKVFGLQHPETLTIMGNLALTYQEQGQWSKAETLQATLMETCKTVLGNQHPTTLASIERLAVTYQRQGQWAKAEALQATVVEYYKKVHGPQHLHTLGSIGNLATIYQSQGCWADAKTLLSAVIENCKEVLGAQHPATLASMSNLAAIFHQQGQWSEAEALQVTIMDARKTVLGAKHPVTLASIGNLAATHQQQGQWAKAEALQLTVMEAFKTALGLQHPETLTSMNNLASTYLRQGLFAKAEALQVIVLETRKTVFGLQHPDTLTSVNNLAATCQQQGQWTKAEALQFTAFEASKTVLGPQHPETLSIMNNLALTYLEQGRWSDAEALQLKVLEISKTVYGVQHPEMLKSMGNLALTYQQQGRLAEAEVLQFTVMLGCSTVLGPQHPEMLASMSNLATTYRQQGQFAKAKELQVTVMKTCKTVLGARHLTTLKSMNNLALTYQELGHLAEAEALQMTMLETIKTVLSAQHPETLKSMSNLAATYWSQRRFTKAEALQVTVMETRKAVLGVQHPDTLTSMSNLAATYQQQQKFAKAKALQVHVVETRKIVLGVQHLATLASMGNLATTHQQLEQWAEAEMLQMTVMEAFKTMLGMQHPATVKSIKNLALTYQQQGQTAKAEALLQARASPTSGV